MMGPLKQVDAFVNSVDRPLPAERGSKRGMLAYYVNNTQASNIRLHLTDVIIGYQILADTSQSLCTNVRGNAKETSVQTPHKRSV